MGVSKAAVYYHYKTKEELVVGVLAPLLEALPGVVREAEKHRGRQARTDAIVTGMARLATENHPQYAVIIRDPYVARVLVEQPSVVQSWQRMVELVTGPEPDVQARMAVLMYLSGLSNALIDPVISTLPADEVREHLIECGRRLLQIRRRPGA
jgi:AcrR family transcriptional regulator